MPIPFLSPSDELTPFPDPSAALEEPNGLLMAGGSLSPARLRSAYRSGIFPWYDDGEPILWWSPDPRCVIYPDSLKISRSLRKTLRNAGYTVTHDRAFADVIRQCAAPRTRGIGTWVSQAMIDAFCRLHRLGAAHSVEVWHDDELVGGLYGVGVGRVFVGESMFSRRRDTSKVALVHLAGDSRYELIDCQLETAHLRSLGAVTISRERYLDELRALSSDTASSTVGVTASGTPGRPVSDGADRPVEGPAGGEAEPATDDAVPTRPGSRVPTG